MTAITLILRGFEMTPMNLEMMLGSLLTGRVGVLTWFLGLAAHLTVSILLGLTYGAVMEVADRRGAWIGLLIGTAHTIFSGLLLATLASAHPLVRTGEMLPPGIFAANLGPLKSSFLSASTSSLARP